MQTTTISLDERTHLALRHLALDRGVAFRDLIRDAIRDYLARQARKEGR